MLHISSAVQFHEDTRDGVAHRASVCTEVEWESTTNDENNLESRLANGEGDRDRVERGAQGGCVWVSSTFGTWGLFTVPVAVWRKVESDIIR